MGTCASQKDRMTSISCDSPAGQKISIIPPSDPPQSKSHCGKQYHKPNVEQEEYPIPNIQRSRKSAPLRCEGGSCGANRNDIQVFISRIARPRKVFAGICSGIPPLLEDHLVPHLLILWKTPPRSTQIVVPWKTERVSPFVRSCCYTFLPPTRFRALECLAVSFSFEMGGWFCRRRPSGP